MKVSCACEFSNSVYNLTINCRFFDACWTIYMVLDVRLKSKVMAVDNSKTDGQNEVNARVGISR